MFGKDNEKRNLIKYGETRIQEKDQNIFESTSIAKVQILEPFSK